MRKNAEGKSTLSSTPGRHFWQGVGVHSDSIRSSAPSGQKSVVEALDRLLRPRVHFSDTATPVLDNIYTYCDTGINQGHCKGSKLIIKQSKYDQFIEVMAQDVTNHLKTPGLFLLGTTPLTI